MVISVLRSMSATEKLSTEIRLLSLDPGFVNLGWSILSARGSVVSVTKYGVYKFCEVKPSTSDIEQGLVGLAENVLRPYANMYDYVVLETQPYINSRGNADKLLNFNLQRIDTGLRGLAIGLGKKLFCVECRSVRLYLGTSTGDYDNNKRSSVDWCYKIGLVFTELPHFLRNHVADTVCNAFYVLSKRFSVEFDDDALSELFNPHRPTSKRRPKRAPLARDDSPPVVETGDRASVFQDPGSPDQ